MGLFLRMLSSCGENRNVSSSSSKKKSSTYGAGTVVAGALIGHSIMDDETKGEGLGFVVGALAAKPVAKAIKSWWQS
jgi:hypothetical protein